MIVPGMYAVHDSGIEVNGFFTLPMGVMTANFTDLATGSATEHTGSLGFQVSNAAAFVSHPKAHDIVTTAIVAATTGIMRAWVRIMSITASSGGRRLYDSSFRRLTSQ